MSYQLLKYQLLLCVCVFLSSCETQNPDIDATAADVPVRFALAAIADDDNLPEETQIINLNIFLAEPNSGIITHKFVNQSFTSNSNDCKTTKLPLDPAIVAYKDVYVVANFADNAALQSISTVDDIKRLKTPQLANSQSVIAADGLPMYGEAKNTNLGISTAAAPAQITLVRACAKLHITLLFPDADYAGENNSFVIENAAPYTYFVPNDTFSIAPSALINCQSANFTEINPQQYIAAAYLYESAAAPRLHIYSNINGTPHDYIVSSNFPLPARNYMYDIEVRILKSTTRISVFKHLDNAD